MKLKNIFPLLLSFVVLTTACENDDLVPEAGSPIPGNKGELAALMISSSMGSEAVQTKSPVGFETTEDNKYDKLYVFVYEQGENGAFLGSGSSEETTSSKNTKLQSLSPNSNFEDMINERPKDVIVTTEGIVSGKTVDVILIANPPENFEASYYTGKQPSKSDLLDITVNLQEQVTMYNKLFGDIEDGGCTYGHSTACQRISMTLSAGVNYLGEKHKGGVDGLKWNTKYENKLPLYRLLSNIRLKAMMTSQDKEHSFILTKVYLKPENGCVTTSHLVPSEIVSIPNNTSVDKDNFDIWCKAIANNAFSSIVYDDKKEDVLSYNDNALRLNEKIYPGPTETPLRGVVVTSGIASQAKENDWRPLQAVYWSAINVAGYEQIKKDGKILPYVFQDNLYSFETEGRSAATLILEGYYTTSSKINEGSDCADILIPANHCKYEVPISKDGKFARGYIYNLTVTIKGKGTSTENPDPTPDLDNVNATIKISPMGDKELEFTFGEE